MVVGGHRLGHVGLGVAVRPQHLLARAVPGDRGRDLLPAADDAAVDEVAISAHLRREPWLGAAIVPGAGHPARAAAAAPLEAEVPVEVDTIRRRAGDRLAVAPPLAELAAGDVPLAAVGVEHRDDEDLGRIDNGRDALVAAVAVGQDADEVQVHLGRRALARVSKAVEENLRLVLVELDVVADLQRPDLAALVAAADGELLRDVWVGRHRRVEEGLHLGIGVVRLEAGRHRCRGARRRRRQPGQQADGHRGDGVADSHVLLPLQKATAGASSAGHGHGDRCPC